MLHLSPTLNGITVSGLAVAARQALIVSGKRLQERSWEPCEKSSTPPRCGIGTAKTSDLTELMESAQVEMSPDCHCLVI
jgi:hypothetical protein